MAPSASTPSAASSETRSRTRRLGQLLKEAGLLDDGELGRALKEQRKWGGRLGRTLVSLGICDEETVVHALGKQMALPAVHLDTAPFDPAALEAVPVEVAERYHVFPLTLNKRQKLLRVASADPGHVPVLEALTFHTGMRVLFCIAGEEAISRALRRHYHREAGLARLPTPAEAAQMGVTQVNLAFQWPQQLTETLRAEKARNHVRLSELEALVQHQGRALRSMLEILDREGVIRREQFLARMEAPKSAPPPLPLERTGKSRVPPSLLPELPSGS